MHVRARGYARPTLRLAMELAAAGEPLALVAAGAEPEDISEEAFATQLDLLNAYVELLCPGR